MGWVFEYLGWDLHEQVLEKLKKFGVCDHPKFDRETLGRTEYGDGWPETGHYTGLVETENGKYEIEYTIRRKPPEGLDYCEGEQEYECVLDSIKREVKT